MNFTRNELQREAANQWVDKGIFFISPRMGKIRISFLVAENQGFKNILVLAPRKDIFEGWRTDRIKFKFKENLYFSTFASCDKIIGNYDLVVVD